MEPFDTQSATVWRIRYAYTISMAVVAGGGWRVAGEQSNVGVGNIESFSFCFAFANQAGLWHRIDDDSAMARLCAKGAEWLLNVGSIGKLVNFDANRLHTQYVLPERLVKGILQFELSFNIAQKCYVCLGSSTA